MTIYRIENPGGDDPYGDIKIKLGGTTICKFPQDDAPVFDFNATQRALAEHVVAFLNSRLEERS